MADRWFQDKIEEWEKNPIRKRPRYFLVFATYYNQGRAAGCIAFGAVTQTGLFPVLTELEREGLRRHAFPGHSKLAITGMIESNEERDILSAQDSEIENYRRNFDPVEKQPCPCVIL